MRLHFKNVIVHNEGNLKVKREKIDFWVVHWQKSAHNQQYNR